MMSTKITVHHSWHNFSWHVFGFTPLQVGNEADVLKAKHIHAYIHVYIPLSLLENPLSKFTSADGDVNDESDKLGAAFRKFEQEKFA